MPPRDRRGWGQELGRRFRDQMRAARGTCIAVEAWQLDEVLGECASRSDYREFIGGV